MSYSKHPSSQADIPPALAGTRGPYIPLGKITDTATMVGDYEDLDFGKLGGEFPSSTPNLGLPRNVRTHDVDADFIDIFDELVEVVEAAYDLYSGDNLFELDPVDVTGLPDVFRMPGFVYHKDKPHSNGQNIILGALIDIASESFPPSTRWSVGLPSVAEPMHGPLSALFVKVNMAVDFYVMRGEAPYTEFHDRIRQHLESGRSESHRSSTVNFHDGEKLDLIFVPKSLNHLLRHTSVTILSSHLKPSGSLIGSYPAANRVDFLRRQRGLSTVDVSPLKHTETLGPYYEVKVGKHTYLDPTLSIGDLRVEGRDFLDASFAELLRPRGPLAGRLGNLKNTPELSFIMRFYILKPLQAPLPPLPSLHMSDWEKTLRVGYNFDPLDNDPAVAMSKDELLAVCPNQYCKTKDNGELVLIWVTAGYSFMRRWEGQRSQKLTLDVSPYYVQQTVAGRLQGDSYILQAELVGDEILPVQINKVFRQNNISTPANLSWLSRQGLIPGLLDRWTPVVRPHLKGHQSNLPDFASLEEGLVLVDAASSFTCMRQFLKDEPDKFYWVGISRYVKKVPTADILGPTGATVEIQLGKTWPENYVRDRPGKSPNDPLRLWKLENAVTVPELILRSHSHYINDTEVENVALPEDSFIHDGTGLKPNFEPQEDSTLSMRNFMKMMEDGLRMEPQLPGQTEAPDMPLFIPFRPLLGKTEVLNREPARHVKKSKKPRPNMRKEILETDASGWKKA